MKPRFLSILLLGLMLAAAGSSVALKPGERIAEQRPRINLESMIPTQFADWQIDSAMLPVTVSQDVQAKLEELYDQTLARTYTNSDGQRIMLSIAYGGDQSGDRSQVHRPEFCYTAQGFQLSNVFENTLPTGQGSLPVRRLLATQGSRHEPITYWITVGDKATLPGVGRKLIQMRYGLTGKVPDGLLVRVSSIELDSGKAYRLQDQFVRDLLAASSEQHRAFLAGRFVR
ncbi:MAG TPA: EpsI family protein [Candidatus Accumulibacter phosphatis]|nr:EpsI family protein [Candidatus Accumulibacter phosphatis]